VIIQYTNHINQNFLHKIGKQVIRNHVQQNNVQPKHHDLNLRWQILDMRNQRTGNASSTKIIIRIKRNVKKRLSAAME
jgi:hypothetical protein